MYGGCQQKASLLVRQPKPGTLYLRLGACPRQDAAAKLGKEGEGFSRRPVREHEESTGPLRAYQAVGCGCDCLYDLGLRGTCMRSLRALFW